jgi:hypothetical protein
MTPRAAAVRPMSWHADLLLRCSLSSGSLPLLTTHHPTGPTRMDRPMTTPTSAPTTPVYERRQESILQCLINGKYHAQVQLARACNSSCLLSMSGTLHSIHPCSRYEKSMRVSEVSMEGTRQNRAYAAR